jgi:hypothetical protein
VSHRAGPLSVVPFYDFPVPPGRLELPLNRLSTYPLYHWGTSAKSTRPLPGTVTPLLGRCRPRGYHPWVAERVLPARLELALVLVRSQVVFPLTDRSVSIPGENRTPTSAFAGLRLIHSTTETSENQEAEVRRKRGSVQGRSFVWERCHQRPLASNPWLWPSQPPLYGLAPDGLPRFTRTESVRHC